MPTKIVEIPLSGLSTSPSDYECKDGELAAAVNAFHKDGTITSSTSPRCLIKLDYVVFNKYKDNNTYSAMYDTYYMQAHYGTDYDHIIVHARFGKENGDHMYFSLDVTNGFIEKLSSHTFLVKERFSDIDGIEIKSIFAIGNVLMFYSENKTYYYIWKEDRYTYLGDEIPELDMAFSLVAHNYTIFDHLNTDNIESTFDFFESNLPTASISESPSSASRPFELNEGDDNIVTTAAMAAAGKMDKWCHENGYFSQPFFVRYALRMYDGSVTKMSAPVLMMPAEENPLIHVMSYNCSNRTMSLDACGVGCQLAYIIKNIPEKLLLWKDLIYSVDIFVSSPIYTYDQSGTCKTIEYTNPDSFGYIYPKYAKKIRSVCDISNIGSSNTTLGDVLEKTSIDFEYYPNYINRGNNEGQFWAKGNRPIGKYEYENVGGFISWLYYPFIYSPLARVKMPKPFDINEQIRSASSFYLLKSINLEDLKTNSIGGTGEAITLERYALQSIYNRDVLEEDYDSHHRILPSSMIQYNARYTFTGINKSYYSGQNSLSAFQRIFNHWDQDSLHKKVECFVTLNHNGKQFIRKNKAETFNLDFYPQFFFYPDADARSVDIFCYGYNMSTGEFDPSIDCKKIHFDLKLHSFLNGCYAYIPFDVDIKLRADGKQYYYYRASEEYWKASVKEEYESFVNKVDSNTFDLVNEVRTSNANNPFIITAANVEQVSSGNIISLVPAAQALSTGQFGEYPMYAFTTDGIWALYPSETGGWKSKQPISRDVALSSNSILQLDQSVIFATARGLMEIRGSQVTCISECFNGNSDSFLSNNKSKEHTKKVLNDFSDIVVNTESDLFVSFRDFIATGHMHYDYTHQRIIISNASYPICYVFNIKDALWTTMVLNVISDVNSYPNCYAVENDGKNNLLIDFTQTGPASAVSMPSDAFILTRPIKLDEPDALKTVRTVVARGNFSANKSAGDRPYPLSLILYASRDMEQWYVIASSKGPRLVSRHGTPYRYFRVGIISHLRDGESLSRLTFEYEFKLTNKVR